MPVKSVKLGPGTLTFGPATPTMDASAQVQNCVVGWDKDKADDITVLTGEVVGGGTTYTATLSGTFLQDLATGGLVEWSWDNKGSQQAFTFTPNTANGTVVTGQVIVDPIDVGTTEDYGTTMSSDFEWDCVGEPVYAGGTTLAAEAGAPRQAEPVGA